MSAKDLQDLLNHKLQEEGAFFRTALTIYESERISREKGKTGCQVYCSILVFEQREPDLEDERTPYIVTEGTQEMYEKPEAEVSRFIYEQELLQKFKFCALVPKTGWEQSLMVFKLP